MNNVEKLKAARQVLLRLHKSLIDREKEFAEGIHGPITPNMFLGMLLNDPDFQWLRRFSTAIVEVDELFAAKDGISDEVVDEHLGRLKAVVEMESDEYFAAKYQSALQQSSEIAGHHSEFIAYIGVADDDEG
ncbi:MAG: hypothetical protein IPM21_17370 [Acidobacteria bacterium]|nr:hypothetical protein [Acidobacteriota bacterium]